MPTLTMTIEDFYNDSRFDECVAFLNGRQIDEIWAGFFGTTYDGIWRVWYTDAVGDPARVDKYDRVTVVCPDVSPESDDEGSSSADPGAATNDVHLATGEKDMAMKLVFVPFTAANLSPIPEQRALQMIEALIKAAKAAQAQREYEADLDATANLSVDAGDSEAMP